MTPEKQRVGCSKSSQHTNRAHGSNIVTVIKSCQMDVLFACAVAMLVYVNDAKRQDAAEFNKRLVKDRHTTARNLRNYYLRCLAKLLDADFDQ